MARAILKFRDVAAASGILVLGSFVTAKYVQYELTEIILDSTERSMKNAIIQQRFCSLSKKVIDRVMSHKENQDKFADISCFLLQDTGCKNNTIELFREILSSNETDYYAKWLFQNIAIFLVKEYFTTRDVNRDLVH